MSDKVKLFSLCMVLFIDAIGSGLILPILPELFLNQDYGLLLGYGFQHTSLIYGITLAVFPLASLFGKYLLGALSDHFGRKKTILAGLSIILLSYLLSIVAIVIDSVPLFLLARFITGFGAGTYTAVYAMISDVSKTLDSKMTNFKWPALATVLGFIVGPILGGTSSIADGPLSLIIPFGVGLMLTLLNILKAKSSLIETLKTNPNSNISLVTFINESYHYLLNIRHNPSVTLLLSSYFFLQLAIGLYVQSISLYLAKVHHFTSQQISFFYVIMGCAILLNTVLIQKRLQDKSSPQEILVGISLFGAVVFVLLEVSRVMLNDNIVLLFAGSFFIYLLLNLSINIYTATLSQYSPRSEQGKLISLAGQTYSLTWFIASLLGGVMVINKAFLLFCSIFLVFSLFFIIRFKHLENISSRAVAAEKYRQ